MLKKLLICPVWNQSNLFIITNSVRGVRFEQYVGQIRQANLGLFQIRFQYILALRAKMY